MSPFVHQRHKAPTPLQQDRPLVVAVPAMQSQVNLARIVRAAGCCGVRRVVTARPAKLDAKIARAAATYVQLDVRRSLPAVIRRWRDEGFRVVGVEQAEGAQSLYDYRFAARSLLLLGHERLGLSDELLALADDVVEIPIYGLPHSHNVATSAAIVLYEYCRQFPRG